MIYHLHFAEANCPYDDDALFHDAFIKADKDFDVSQLFEEVETLKDQMDDYGYEDENEDEDFVNEIYDQYCDLGWNEKIDEAIKLAVSNHPEWDIEILEVESCVTQIN